MLSAAQYAAARAATATTGGGNSRIHVTSTLRDRTPVAQEKPLDDGQFKWGKPSSFSWGSRATVKETGPYTRTTHDVNWPDYGLNPQPDQPSDPLNPDEGLEREELEPIVYDWKEVARIERTVRITGSNGAYVDINRMDEVIFAIPTSADGRSQFVRMVFAKV